MPLLDLAAMRLTSQRVALPVGQIVGALVGKLCQAFRIDLVSARASSVKPASAVDFSRAGKYESRLRRAARFCFWRSGAGQMSIGSSAEYLETSVLSCSRRLR